MYITEYNDIIQGSVSSFGGVSSASTITHQLMDTSHMSPTQLCKLGYETLQQAVIYWEDGLMKLSFNEDRSKPAILDPETAELQHQMDQLLDAAYRMIDTYERQAERQADHIALESAMAAFTETDLQSERTRSFDAGSLSDQDSFVSATDVIFQQPSQRDYFKTMGKQLIGDLMIRADRDPEEFYTTYNAMLDFVEIEDSWHKIEEELKGRGVKCMTFYDIVLDFILMDAFDDLENPPSSVIAVIQNRWLSNSFKETALSTAVWSVLKAKRRMLKESVLKFLRDMFSFEYVRYTTVEELADDVAKLLRNRIEEAAEKISPEKLEI
uniref:Protein FAM73B n=1 Tax=Magallana gigas TaxID=29159 RepID=K1PCA6_MAGGI